MINPGGDLIVRPTFIEAAAQLMRPWGTLLPLCNPHCTHAVLLLSICAFPVMLVCPVMLHGMFCRKSCTLLQMSA